MVGPSVGPDGVGIAVAVGHLVAQQLLIAACVQNCWLPAVDGGDRAERRDVDDAAITGEPGHLRVRPEASVCGGIDVYQHLHRAGCVEAIKRGLGAGKRTGARRPYRRRGRRLPARAYEIWPQADHRAAHVLVATALLNHQPRPLDLFPHDLVEVCREVAAARDVALLQSGHRRYLYLDEWRAEFGDFSVYRGVLGVLASRGLWLGRRSSLLRFFFFRLWLRL